MDASRTIAVEAHLLRRVDTVVVPVPMPLPDDVPVAGPERWRRPGARPLSLPGANGSGTPGTSGAADTDAARGPDTRTATERGPAGG